MERIDIGKESWYIQSNLPESFEIDFDALWNLHPAEYNKVKIMGNIIDTPRWQCSYLRAYAFTGMNHEALPLPDEIRPFLDWANGLFPGEWQFNQVLANWYRNGHHYIGAHSDDTRPLIDNSPIVSISLGQERTFRIRQKSTKKIVTDISMPDRSYVIMGGEMQKHFTHEVTKISGTKGESVGPRINITFRVFK